MLHSRIIGTGEPLVILHGFLGMGDNWKTLANKFAENGYEVHLVDQRNHGRSFRSDDFSYDLLAEDLKQYCTDKGLRDINLIGHSMGGKTAMLYATIYPDSVGKLIVADIGPKFYPQHHQKILEGLQALASNVDAMKSRSAADDYMSQYIKDAGVRMFLLKNLYWVEKGQLGMRINLPVLVSHIEEVGKALPEGRTYDGPVLFLRGEHSDYIKDTDERELFSAFAKATITTIPNAGHWLHAENPDDFLKEVVNFL